MNVSVIIPAYNEEAVLEKTVRRAQKILHPYFGKDLEFLLCNDHSKDKTEEIIKRLSNELSGVRGTSNPGDGGFGNVLRHGFSQAKGKYIIPMMADLCDDPHTVIIMYEKMQEGYDVVVGSRYMKGGKKLNVQNHFKSLLSRIGGYCAKLVYDVGTLDATNAFKLMRKDLVLKARPTSNTFDISYELTIKLSRMGARMTEVPTTWVDRSAGESKFRVFKVIRKYIKWLIV